MKRLMGLAIAMLTLAAADASPVGTHSVKAYTCTTSSKAVWRVRFGPGEYSEFDSNKGDWGDNQCAAAGTTCAFKGSKFSADLGPSFFTSTAAGKYVRGDVFGASGDTGKCVPE